MKVKFSYYLSISAISLLIVSLIIFIFNDEIDIYRLLAISLNIGVGVILLNITLLIIHFIQLKRKNLPESNPKKKLGAIIISLLIIPTFMLSTIIAEDLSHSHWSNEHPRIDLINSYNCEEATELARKHADDSNLGVILGGLTFPEEYAKMLREKYHIKTYVGGCVVMEGRSCYNDYMKKLIKEKFGENCFEEVMN
jgi:amino acid transporter